MALFITSRPDLELSILIRCICNPLRADLLSPQIFTVFLVLPILSELKLALSTEKESNKLLLERISSLEKTSSAEAADQLREKLKKKQVWLHFMCFVLQSLYMNRIKGFV